MLPSIDVAYCVKGRKKAAIAREMEMTPGHISKWFSGLFYIPKGRRKMLELSLGSPVDWDAYERDFIAHQNARAAAPVDRTPAAAPHPAPEKPALHAEAPKTPATPPRRLTATPPAAAANMPPPAPKKGGLFGFLTSTDGDLFA